ncbi:MAG: hypothetical protein O2917_09205, partial [Acidobacteria bacterium]|nr:hypothetical protein [Acidobacteriota bacterium]
MRVTLTLFVCALVAGAAVPAAQNAPPVQSTLTKGPLFDHYLSGSPEDVAPKTGGGLFLAGGGTDQPEAFAWFIRKAGG